MLKQKLNRAKGHLAKTRYYLPPNLRRTLYFSIIESHHRYGCQIWEQQKSQHIHDIENFQRKTIRIMNFKSKSILSQNYSLTTFQNMMKSENCLLVLQQVNRT